MVRPRLAESNLLALEARIGNRHDERGNPMEMVWLSVIIPSHNGERWLGAALQSVADQKDKGIEVILIDSSATDTSLRIADRFSDTLNIRAERRPDLPSWTEKTNWGVEQAKGDHICMLHQDDIWLPNRCNHLRKWLSDLPDAAMYLHSCYFIDEAGKRLGLWRCPLPGGERPIPARTLFQRLLVQCFVGIPTPTIRRDAYIRVGGLDNALWQSADWDLYLKLSKVGDIYYHPNALSCFRIHRNSLTVSGSRTIKEYRDQLDIVLYRHAANPSSRLERAVLRAAKVSIDVNVALAAANNGEFVPLFKALLSMMALGPAGMHRYVFCSRIVERAGARLRARFAGTF
jgi:glycosyltransferase involved in cell wall biosynthesis